MEKHQRHHSGILRSIPGCLVGLTFGTFGGPLLTPLRGAAFIAPQSPSRRVTVQCLILSSDGANIKENIKKEHPSSGVHLWGLDVFLFEF